MFSVHGLAGVGKTFLLEQLRGIAEESRAAVGFADDGQQDLPATLVELAKDLARGGHDMRRFEKRHEFYLKARERLHSDPQAPAGGRELLTKTIVKVGLGLAKSVPGGDLAAEVIDPAAAAKQLEQLQTYLAAKFKRQADIRLLLDPAEELTKPFVEDLWRVPESRQIALFFDTFERTAPVLEPWLLNLLSGRYGDLPQNLVLTMAGQFPLDEAKWNRHAPLVHETELRPFTDGEARHLLAEHGITDEKVIEVVLTLSNGLPVLVDMLARGNPAEAGEVGDPSGDAVDRFLRWVPEDRMRTIAATAALPRVLDEDVLSVLTGPEQARETFRWLRELPFVSRRELPARYHPVVRGPMVRLERGRAPGTFAEQHRRLAEYYETRCAELGLDRREGWTDERWQQRKLEQCYHLICGDPAEALPEALLGAAEMITTGTAAARVWVRMMEQAGTDADAPRVHEWARRLSEGIGQEDGPRDVEVLDLLAGSAALDAARLSTVIRRRGWAHEGRNDFAAAKLDYDQAIGLNPADPYAWYDRGHLAYTETEWAKAMEYLDKSIALDLSYPQSWRIRGAVRAETGEYAHALEDLDEAIRLEPANAWSHALRSAAFRGLEDIPKAIGELDTAIRLDPGYTWAKYQRAVLLERQGDTEAAERQFDEAVGADPVDAWLVAGRAAFWHRTGRSELALAGFTAAIALDPDYEWAWYMRGDVLEALGDSPAAMADFNRAIELEPADVENRSRRAFLHSRARDWAAVLTDIEVALEQEPDSARFHARKGEALSKLDRHEEARAEVEKAVELDPGSGLARYERGEHRLLFGELPGALTDLNQALSLGINEEVAVRCRAEAHLWSGDHASALADWRRAVELDADRYNRTGLAEVLVYGGEYAEALEVLPADTGESNWMDYIAGLAELGTRSERAGERLTRALDRAIADAEADPRDWSARFNQVVYLVALDRGDEAKQRLTEVLGDGPTVYSRVDVRRDLEGLRKVVPGRGPLIDELVAEVPPPVLNPRGV